MIEIKEVSVGSLSKVKKLPRLFKKTNTGAIQTWDIFVQNKEVDQGKGVFLSLSEIVTVYGQKNTPSPQITKDVIAQGKNPGKKNATTAFEQAVKEATSKWTKQLKKGYVESEDDAQAKLVDSIIEGGIFPMLAHSFSKHPSKIKWPCFIQPKFDGIRCIAIVANGKATLWSRTRKPITSMPHIVAELEANFTDIILDGELYQHLYKNNFEEIVSQVRQEVPQPGHEIVQYHVYDIVSDSIYADRQSELQSAMATVDFNIIVPVQTGMVQDEEQVTEMFAQITLEGYEGVMLRNGEGLYEQNKRSKDLQKVKEFNSEEFTIVNIEEGRGKLAGHVGAFVCEDEAGNQFKAKMSGSLEMLRIYFQTPSLWEGKQLTVKFQGLTSTNAVPRFPIGIAIRDYE